MNQIYKDLFLCASPTIVTFLSKIVYNQPHKLKEYLYCIAIGIIAFLLFFTNLEASEIDYRFVRKQEKIEKAFLPYIEKGLSPQRVRALIEDQNKYLRNAENHMRAAKEDINYIGDITIQDTFRKAFTVYCFYRGGGGGHTGMVAAIYGTINEIGLDNLWKIASIPYHLSCAHHYYALYDWTSRCLMCDKILTLNLDELDPMLEDDGEHGWMELHKPWEFFNFNFSEYSFFDDKYDY